MLPARLFAPWLFSTLALGLLCSQAGPARAQGGLPPNNRQEMFQKIDWQQGPCEVTLRHIGKVKVPAGCKFTGEAGAATMMQVTNNLPNPKDMGLMCPATYTINPGCKDWFLVFVWEDIGYVKDDDKGNLDANAILQSLQQGQVEGNRQRKAMGLPDLNLVGWEQAPFYDPDSNNLTWATRVRLAGGMADAINYNSRILGRGGVVSVELVIDPGELQKALPMYKDIIKGYSFLPGQRYAEWRAGDRVAAVGLTALISGGVVAAAAKSGLLGKFGKFIIYIVIGAAAAIGSVVKKIFGRKDPSGA